MTLWLPEWLVWIFAAYGAGCLANAVARGIIKALGRTDTPAPGWVRGEEKPLPPISAGSRPTKDDIIATVEEAQRRGRLTKA